MTAIDELDQLERQLGDRLAETFDACLGTRRSRSSRPSAALRGDIENSQVASRRRNSDIEVDALAAGRPLPVSPADGERTDRPELASEHPGPADPTGSHPGHRSAGRRSTRPARVWLTTAAAALVAVGVAAVIDRVGTSPVTGGAGDGAAGTPGHVSEIAGAEPPTPPAPPVPADLTMYMPTFIPPGYVLDDIELSLNVSRGEELDDAGTGLEPPGSPNWAGLGAAYVQRSGDDVTATVTISVHENIAVPQEPDARGAGLAPSPGTLAESVPAATEPTFAVRGVPAVIYDSGLGLVASWSDGTRQISLVTTGIDGDELERLAEQVSIDDAGIVAPLPADLGWEALELPPAPPDHPVTPAIEYRRADDPSGSILIVRWPNYGRDPIELMTLQDRQLDRHVAEVTVRGLPGFISSLSERPGARNYLRWNEGDGTWLISGKQSAAVLVQIAESLAPIPLDAARGRRVELDHQLMAQPELDRIVLDNGIELSVHQIGPEPGAICVHQPVTLCERSSSGVDFGSPSILAAVPIDGQPWTFGWIAGDHDPAQAGTVGPRTSSIADDFAGGVVAHTDTGTFVAIPADGVMLTFDRSVGSYMSVTVDPHTVDLLREPLP